MDKIVGPELLPSKQEIHGSPESILEFHSHEQKVKKIDDSDQHRKFSDIDNVLMETCMSIYPSKRKGFALQALGLKESKYNLINNETIGAMQKNGKVFLEKERILKCHFESCD